MRSQDFEKAGQLRDREMELKAKIQAVIAGAKEQSKAEAESVESGGPLVNEQDIAGIVAQWTGIPIEKVSQNIGYQHLHSSCCACWSLLRCSCCYWFNLSWRIVNSLAVDLKSNSHIDGLQNPCDISTHCLATCVPNV